MLKKLLCISAIIFLMVATYTVAAHRVQAQGPSSIRVVGTTGSSTEPFVATDTQIWSYNGGWKTLSQANVPEPPVPANQVLCYSGSLTITTSGEAYQWVQTTWVSRGVIPGGAIAVQPESWTGVKKVYR